MRTVRTVYSLSAPDSAFIAGETRPFVPAQSPDPLHTMVVDPSRKHRSILGLGGIWTDTDLHALLRMAPEKQEEALHAILDPDTGMGWNLIRLPFGSTDWEVNPDFYTYDDMPRGEKDWELEHFSVQRDIDRGYFDVLRRCKEIRPDLIYFGSVWGMPAWMKDSDSIMYGRFDPACTRVYAKYLARTVLAYKEQGIDLYAVTPQNESLTANDRATPATRMTWWVQRDLAIAMREEFDKAGLDTRVWVYDHNFDMSDYFVAPMLEDEALRNAIDAVAFHDYGGDPFVMRDLAAKYPDIHFYMTERTITSVPEMNNLVQEFRCDAESYVQWTTMSDEYGGPHSFMGAPFVYSPRRAAGDRLNFLYNLREAPNDLRKGPSFGIYGIFSRYIRRGMVRVDSTAGDTAWMTGTAFTDPESGETVLITVNQTREEQPLTVRCGSEEASFVQPAMSTAAYLFTPEADAAFPVSGLESFRNPEEPAWDITVEEIRLNGEAKAGEELLLSAVVRNVGNAPTPEMATLFVQFSEDGDCQIARANVPLPVLAPGETFEAVSNVPFGMPYCYRVAWLAEKGHHQIFARAVVGNTYAERSIHNNVLAKEFVFE